MIIVILRIKIIKRFHEIFDKKRELRFSPLKYLYSIIYALRTRRMFLRFW